MKLYNFDQISSFEKYLIEKLDYRSIILMENAANSIVDFLIKVLNGNIEQIYPIWQQKKLKEKLVKSLNIFNLEKREITFLVGSGNNGGDALAIARKLIIRKKNKIKVNILNFGNAKTELRIYQENLLRILNFENIEFFELKDEEIFNLNPGENIKKIISAPILIDGITGIGLKPPLDEKLIRKIEIIERYKDNDSFIISIDLPTGLAEKSEKVINVDITLMLQWAKQEFFTIENRKFSLTYDILPCDMLISNTFFNDSLITNDNNNFELVRKEDLKDILKKSEFYSHKGNFGKVFIISNSLSTFGATVIASKAAIKSGAGYVYLILNKEYESFCKVSLPYIITIGYDKSLNLKFINNLLEKDFKTIEKDNKRYNCTVIIGSGFGKDKEKFFIFFNNFIDKNINILVDGDGLNIIAENIAEFAKISKNRKAKLVFTPHQKEFDRIFEGFINLITMS